MKKKKGAETPFNFYYLLSLVQVAEDTTAKLLHPLLGDELLSRILSSFEFLTFSFNLMI